MSLADTEQCDWDASARSSGYDARVTDPCERYVLTTFSLCWNLWTERRASDRRSLNEWLNQRNISEEPTTSSTATAMLYNDLQSPAPSGQVICSCRRHQMGSYEQKPPFRASHMLCGDGTGVITLRDLHCALQSTSFRVACGSDSIPMAARPVVLSRYYPCAYVRPSTPCFLVSRSSGSTDALGIWNWRSYFSADSPPRIRVTARVVPPKRLIGTDRDLISPICSAWVL